MNYLKNIEELIIENEAIWNIGKLIVEAQGGVKRAKYGDNLIKEWGKKLSLKYGKGYNDRSLERMRKLYVFYPIPASLRPELTWTHYRTLLSIKNENERNYYCAVIIDM